MKREPIAGSSMPSPQKKVLMLLLPWLLAVATGGAMSLTFPPYDRPGFAGIPFFAFTPLASALLCLPLPASFKRRLRFTFLLGFVAGATFFILTMEWITSVAWEGLVTLPFYLALYAGFWGVFVGCVLRPWVNPVSSSLRNLLVAFFAAAGWSGLEWLRGTLFTGFGWNSFGVAFHHTIPLLQLCDVTGVAGLSFLGVMTGCVSATAAKRLIDETRSGKPGQKSHELFRLAPLSFRICPTAILWWRCSSFSW